MTTILLVALALVAGALVWAVRGILRLTDDESVFEEEPEPTEAEIRYDRTGGLQ